MAFIEPVHRNKPNITYSILCQAFFGDTFNHIPPASMYSHRIPPLTVAGNHTNLNHTVVPVCSDNMVSWELSEKKNKETQ